MFHGNVSPEIAAGLLKLKERIDAAKIPPSKLDESINIATWNIREFGKKRRSEAAIHYIAEIIGQFDLVGMVELRDNLSDLGRVMAILGPYWKVVYSDMIPDAGGNRERIAYLYDERAAQFNGLAAEANEPRKKKGFEYISEESFWRAPYLASFKSGSFDFMVLTTHIRWGDSNEARIGELGRLADWIEAKRTQTTKEDKDLFVMGDFNIPSTNDEMFAAITRHGLEMPHALQKMTFGSNLEKNKRYDQILHHPIYPDNFTNFGGVLDFYVDEAHIPELFPGGMSKLDFTFQMSDHLPLWIQVNTDVDGFKLEQIIQNQS
ncbi:MAG: endonuclease/exonuclease/phosphatase family protein [Armatimonadetes bacterium]|nr:endonuclease/exonuclease/phosphatase family protein [Armatimonadota bacterium]